MKTKLQKFEVLDNEEDNLRWLWNAITMHIDKPRALWFACNAQHFLDNQQLIFGSEDEVIEQVYRKGLGYQMVTFGYVWNEWFDEAFALEEYFMSRLYWHTFQEGISQYIEMLIIKQQDEHLEEIFSDMEFRYCFLTLYEVYISLLKNPDYPVTKMTEFVPLVNKINNLNKTYGDGK